MKKMLQIACVLLLATALLTVPAFAASYGDTFPEGFTFWADSTGDKIIVGGGANSSESASSAASPDIEDAKATELEAYKAELFRLLNETRVENGLTEVARCEEMDAVAAVRAKELSQSFSHYRPNGTWYTTLADEKEITYKYIGENGAKNAASSEPAHQISGWMRSEGHRNNMLLEKHAKVGIGVYYSDQYVYVSMMLYY